MDPLGQRFVRYRDHADIAALGVVFDAAAGQLLSLALQLCGNPSDAEDVLQSTFVRAMEKAADYDPARPMLPWLCGILAGEAANLRRREGRRRSEPLPDLPSAELGPLLAQERSELVAAMRMHVESLPQEQRQVLLLQLQHGLSPAEIAEVVGAAPGTVRMRLHRGLAALRRLLPAGLAALLMGSMHSRGLAAVRQAVLAKATAMAPVLALGGGVLVMKKSVLTTMVVALLCVCAWFAASPPWGELSRDRLQSGIAVAASEGVASSTHDDRDAALSQHEREAAAPTPAAAAATAVAKGSLHVRTMLAQSGESGPRTMVWVSPRSGDVSINEGFHAHTDAAGEALLRDLPVGLVDVRILGAESQTVTIAAGKTTEVIVKCDWPSLSVRGRVVHADGRPAPHASIVLGTQGAVDVVGTCSADGSFTLSRVLRYERIGALLEGYAPSLLRSVEADKDLELVLPGPAAVFTGRVMDAQGVPVLGAFVEVAGSAMPQQWLDPRGFMLELAAMQRQSTAGDGAFGFEVGAGKHKFTVEAPGFAPYAEIVDVFAGERTSREIRLTTGAPLAGRVLDEQGMAVPLVYVQLGGSSGRARRTDDQGRFCFRSAPRGRLDICVTGDPIETLYAERAADASSELVLRVQRRPRYPLRILDEERMPIRDAWVAARTLRAAGKKTDAEGRVVILGSGVSRDQLVMRIAAHGEFTLDWPAHCVPDVETIVVVPRQTLPSAVITGRVLDAAGKPVAEAYAFFGRVGASFLQDNGTPIRDGAMQSRQLVAGDYELQIATADSGVIILRQDVRHVRAEERRDLGEIRIPTMGQLAFRLARQDGQPIADPNPAVFVVDARGEEVRALTTDGSFKPWPPGRYGYHALVEGAQWQRGECEVHPGQPTVVDVLLEPGVRRSLRLPVPVPEWGTPATVHYLLRRPDGLVVEEGDFNPREELPLVTSPSLNVGSWLVELTTDQGRRFVGTFAVEDLNPRAVPLEVAVQPAR